MKKLFFSIALACIGMNTKGTLILCKITIIPTG